MRQSGHDDAGEAGHAGRLALSGTNAEHKFAAADRLGSGHSRSVRGIGIVSPNLSQYGIYLSTGIGIVSPEIGNRKSLREAS
jgi:hypothetical protein